MIFLRRAAPAAGARNSRTPRARGMAITIARARPWAHASRAFAAALLWVGLGRAVPAGAASGAPSSNTTAAPRSATELDAWLPDQGKSAAPALPHEARIFYHRGVAALSRQDLSGAARDLRAAAELDPSYLAPRFALFQAFARQEPGQALLQAAAIVDLLRERFPLQLALAANLLFFLSHGLFLGLLGAVLILALIHAEGVRHPLEERLKRRVSTFSARIGSLAVLSLPFVTGWGLALPAVVLLAVSWPRLKTRERALLGVFVSVLAAAPLAFQGFDRMAQTLRPEAGPFFGVQSLQDAPYDESRYHRLEQLAERHPESRFLQFALGWSARRGGHLDRAEQAYRKALEQWPHPDRVWNNLGNVLAMRGGEEEATKAYLRAIEVDPRNAAAHFNLAQIYTRRFDYAHATQEMTAASALNFELVRGQQAKTRDDGTLALIDNWIEPATFWKAMLQAPRSSEASVAMPAAWRGRIEAAGWPFSLLVLIVFPLSVALGIQLHRDLPARPCPNCGRMLCRRCAVRQRELALCPACARTAKGAKNPEYAHVLLLQRQRKVEARGAPMRTVLAALIPGFGLLGCRRVVVPVLLIAVASLLLESRLGLETPFPFEPRVAPAGSEGLSALTWIAWALVYVVSFSGYWARRARPEAPVEPAARAFTQRPRFPEQAA